MKKATKNALSRATASLVPHIGGSISTLLEEVQRRRLDAAGETVTGIIEILGEPTLADALDRNPIIEALFVNAVETAMRTGLAAKRRLLARAVADAITDEAQIDMSHVITSALSDLDVPHVRALKAMADEWHEALVSPAESVHWGTSEVWRTTPTPIRAALIRTGTAMPVSSGVQRLVAQKMPNRQEGITDFGLDIVEMLTAEGLQ